MSPFLLCLVAMPASPRQRGRHDRLAIAPGDLGCACEVCFVPDASTRAKHSAGATGRHEREDWFRGMDVFSLMA